MRSRLISALLVLLAAPAFAETRSVEIAPVLELAQAKGGAPKEEAAPRAEPIRDLSRLTDKARQTRQRILDAAKTGDIKKVAAVMQQNEMMPVFSFGGDKDPVEFWQSSYPDSDGIEAVAANLGPDFPSGIFVCHDGRNTEPGPAGNQNFKFVRLERLLDAGTLPA